MIGHYHTVGMITISRPTQPVTMVQRITNSQGYEQLVEVQPFQAVPTSQMLLLKCDECKALVDDVDKIDHADSHMKDRGYH